MEDIQPMTYENDFAEFLTKRDQGKCCLIDEEMFYYWLEVLPPVYNSKEQNGESIRMVGIGGQWMRKDGSLQRFSFAFAEGMEPVTVFWQQNGHYFAQRTNIINQC